MEQLSPEHRTPPSRGPRHVLARAGALTLSLGIVALLMIQAGLPGCFASDPPILADTPPAAPAANDPAAPGAAAKDPAAAAPTPPTPDVAGPMPGEAPPENKHNIYFPGTKAAPFPLDPPPPQQQAPAPQPAKPKGKP